MEFNKYATITSFEEQSLYAKYYRGLALCIRDGLVYSSRPDNLADLRTQAMNLDLCYWECKDEDKYWMLLSSGNLSKPLASSNATSSSSSPSRAKTSHLKSQSRSSTPSSPSSKSKTQDLLKILGSDSKLLPEEKDHCKRLRLCLICGSKEHMAEKCPSHKEIAQGHTTHLEAVSKNSEDEGSASEAESADSPN